MKGTLEEGGTSPQGQIPLKQQKSKKTRGRETRAGEVKNSSPSMDHGEPCTRLNFEAPEHLNLTGILTCSRGQGRGTGGEM